MSEKNDPFDDEPGMRRDRDEPSTSIAPLPRETRPSGLRAVTLFVGACLLLTTVALAFVEIPLLGSVWQNATDEPWTKEGIEETKLVAREIIDALDRCRDAEGAYPDELDVLVPRYLERVPRPKAGCRSWEYRVDDYQGFVLKFYAPGHYPLCYYQRTNAAWCLDD